MKNNIGEAFLILGGLYFLYNYANSWYSVLGTLFLIFLAIASWGYHHNPKEGIENMKLTNEKLRLEIQLMKAQTSFYIAQGAAIMKKVRGG